MSEAFLGFGGNIGDARKIVDEAVRDFCDGVAVRLIARSSDYRTSPWGMTDQPPFINLCLRVETALSPRALLQRALSVEANLGRDRGREQRWGPRPIDIDILAYDNLVVDEPGLRLPHPRLVKGRSCSRRSTRSRPISKSAARRCAIWRRGSIDPELSGWRGLPPDLRASHPLQRHRDALADADAHGGERARPPRRLSSSAAVPAMRAPDMPSGWPSAIAPPFGLTCSASSGSPRPRSTASAWRRRPR